MVLWATLIIFIYGAVLVGSVPYGGAPENITVMFLSPSEVKVSWRTQAQAVEKYDVTYKPTDASYRVVVVVAGNSESVTLTGLQAGTQYQVVITAVAQGKKFRSRPVVFKTLEEHRDSATNTGDVTTTSTEEHIIFPIMNTKISPPQDPVHITGIPPGPAGKNYRPIPPHPNTNPQLVQGVYQVRGVEVGIVCLVLVVWVAAIALFFNRWGKIRMLLPYQPDYKDSQLKRWGSATQNRWEEHQAQHQGLIARLGRTRINSAIYLGQMRSEEAEPLTSSRLALHTIRKIKSADYLPHSYDNSNSYDAGATRSLLRPVLAISHHVDDQPQPTVEQHL